MTHPEYQPQETPAQPSSRSSRRRAAWTIALLTLGVIAAAAAPSVVEMFVETFTDQGFSGFGDSQEIAPAVGELAVEFLRDCLTNPDDAVFSETRATIGGPVWHATGLVQTKDESGKEAILRWAMMLSLLEPHPVKIEVGGELLYDHANGGLIRKYP